MLASCPGVQRVNVMGHPRIGMNLQTVRVSGLNQGVAKELVGRINRKDVLTIVAALDDVPRLAGNDDSGKGAMVEKLCYRLRGFMHNKFYRV